ncbi:MAG: hypothetical protein ACLSVG_03495 [Clostridia bacterium]
MRRKNIAALVLCVIIILLLTGCSQSAEESNVAGKTYIYESEGCGGNFTITIKQDGSFVYYEGYLSSYIGMGKWSVADTVLTLTDDETTGHPYKNRFKISGDDIIFIEDGSSNFLYVKVKDGQIFHGTPTAGAAL